MSQEISNDDWRLHGQEEYLTGATLYWRTWRQISESWDHDHCEFCWDKFMAAESGIAALREGYASEDEQYWKCDVCARDFKNHLGFTLLGGPSAQ